MADNKEQGFNDSELQDIMSEIENLEKEYESDKPEVEMLKDDSMQGPIAEVVSEEMITVTESPEETIAAQEADDAAIIAEVEAVVAETEPVTEETAETTATEEAPEDNIVQFEKKATDSKTTTTSTAQQHVEFHGTGQVDFSLSFEVAGQTAQLEITESGLVVNLDGMLLKVDETNGCTVEMEGGVKFSVPMGGQAKACKAA